MLGYCPASVPVEMGGSGGATNPEQLFAAGYAACLHNALRVVASRQKVRLGQDTSIRAEVGLRATSTGGYRLSVALTVSLPGQDPGQAEAMVVAAPRGVPVLRGHPRPSAAKSTSLQRPRPAPAGMGEGARVLLTHGTVNYS